MKDILTRLSFTVSEEEKRDELGSEGDDEMDFEEDVLRLDYLDEVCDTASINFAELKFLYMRNASSPS